MTKANAPPSKLMGIREYARHRAARNAPGATHPAVRKAIDTGRLVASIIRDGDGKVRIDAAKADVEWGLTSDPAQQRDADEQRKPNAPTAPQPEQLLITGGSEPARPPAVQENVGDRARLVFSLQRGRMVSAKAEMAELELAEMRGELISRDKVADDYYREATKLREAIMSVPRTLARRLGPKNTKLVEASLKEALRTLADNARR